MLRGLTDSQVHILESLFEKHYLKLFLCFLKLQNLVNSTKLCHLFMLLPTHLITYGMKEITAD